MAHSNNGSDAGQTPEPDSFPAGIVLGDSDSDDDDVDYDPMVDEDDDEEYFEAEDPDSDGEAEYEEANEGSLEIEVSLADDGSGYRTAINDVRIRRTNAGGTAIRVSPNQIVQLLGNAGFRRLLASQSIVNRDEDDADDEDIFGGLGRYGRRMRRPAGTQPNFPPVPSPEGQKLMASGNFGSNSPYQDALRKRKKDLARNLMMRELGSAQPDKSQQTSALAQGMIPSSEADTIIHYDQRCYSGQFSDDGNFFFSCSQDFVVRMYDTSNPYDWQHYKSVEYPFPQWTITDATLSPDNKFLAYTSIRSMVCLAPTDPADTRDPHILEFANTASRPGRSGWGTTGFGIWSIRFSGDGRELVAGTGNDSVYVYDIDQGKSILQIKGHSEDVNAVCFGDKNSPHILYSGSDDTLIKVWDRRSMRDSRAAGVFMGHTEGLTYVDSKGDGRYVLSNGKDQTMKLWDLRKMMSTDKAAGIDPQAYSSGYDYRFMTFTEDDYNPHPHDCSLVTFRGHKVLKTLIRCHFSPPGSTNSRYVYSGSEDGKVHVYNMDATSAGVIDVHAATSNSRPQFPGGTSSRYYLDESESQTWKTCVRDASWHPNVPMIAATSWNGWGGAMGTCTIHSWHDGPAGDESGIAMGRRVDCEMRESPELYGTGRTPGGMRSRLRTQRVRRAGNADDEW